MNRHARDGLLHHYQLLLLLLCVSVPNQLKCCTALEFRPFAMNAYHPGEVAMEGRTGRHRKQWFGRSNSPSTGTAMPRLATRDEALIVED